MPYKSERQRRYMHWAKREGKISPKVVEEFDKATPKGSDLPEKVGQMMGGFTPEAVAPPVALRPPPTQSPASPISAGPMDQSTMLNRIAGGPPSAPRQSAVMSSPLNKTGKKDWGPGGKWIHERAHRIMREGETKGEYGAERGKQIAYAIATQQAHKVGRSPKGFRTPQGVREAKSKFGLPKKEYQKTASAIAFGAFADELLQIVAQRIS